MKLKVLVGEFWSILGLKINLKVPLFKKKILLAGHWGGLTPLVYAREFSGRLDPSDVLASGLDLVGSPPCLVYHCH